VAADDALAFGSLFAGIGGIDLGLERAGWKCRWQVEIDPFCQQVLSWHWPDVRRYGDIRSIDWSSVEPVDLLAGGFPCQPVSSAGKQRAQADDRWLWPEFARAIRGLRPRLVLVENVRNLLSVNGGSAFGDVLGDLAASGYDAEWDCIPASAVGAPHQRDRLWLVAYPVDVADAVSDRGGWWRAGSREAAERRSRPAAEGPSSALADAAGWRQPRPGQPLDARDQAAAGLGEATQPLDGRLSDQWQSQSILGGSPHGVPPWLDWPAGPGEPPFAWEPPRVALGVINRVARLKALGNAVVPQVAEYLGTMLADLA
jgi:DNA (cytosine-5)-methyltransferase 1